MAQQGQPQPQPQGVPAPPPPAGHHQVLQHNANVERQLNDLCMELRMSQVAPNVRSFGGEGHQKFVDWVRDMERCKMRFAGDNERMRNLAVATLTGPAADFLLQVIEHTPAATWDQIKAALKQRYSDLSDVLYVRRSMRSLTQSKTESVQNFGERIITAAREAYPGQNLNDPTIQGHLVEIFASGLSNAGIMKLILRKKPVDLDRAIVLAADEQQAIKSFEITRNYRREEDMEIGAVSDKQQDMEKQLENLTKQMLTLTECMQRMNPPQRPARLTHYGQFSYAADGRPICYKCQQPGHIGRNCRQSNRPSGSTNQPLN